MFTILLALTAAFDAGMSVQEMKQTGMTKLSAQEKMALQEWIEGHYAKKEIAQNSNKTVPSLQENLNNGRYIRLTDNSLWEIRQSDTPITQGWITPVEIKVSQSDDSAYPYNLTNTLTGSSVKARKAQAVPASTAMPPPPKK